jgi:hypothetical protein
MPVPLPMSVTMRGVIDRCVLLNYRTPVSSVERFVPRGLRLRTKGGFAFWNVVVCRVHRMRHALAPAALGITYCHVAYRLLVEAELADSSVVSGLHFIRSDANNGLVGLGGNIMSDFRFHGALIDITQTDTRFTATGRSHDGVGNFDLTARDKPAVKLSAGSPFQSRTEAAEFLKYTPVGLAPNRAGSALRLSEVLRNESAWHSTPLEVDRQFFAFFHSARQKAVTLELAERVEPIDYRWRIGRSARLAPLPAEASPTEGAATGGATTGGARTGGSTTT